MHGPLRVHSAQDVYLLYYQTLDYLKQFRTILNDFFTEFKAVMAHFKTAKNTSGDLETEPIYQRFEVFDYHEDLTEAKYWRKSLKRIGVIWVAFNPAD